MLVSRIDIEGRMCRDMYDEHPGFAYFYVDAHRSVPVPKPLTLALAQATAELAWERICAADARTEDFEEHDGQFNASRMVLRGRDGTVMQSFENGHWVSEFNAPEDWDALLVRARELESEASIEAGWDNFSTAENLRHSATALRRRVTISQAHFGVLVEPPEPAPAPRPVRRMRGLDVRAAFALGKILRISTPVEGEDAMSEATMDAEALGMRDHHQGLTEPPVMFADEPLLETAWRTGYAFAARDADSDDNPDWLD
jgi:hypothetical protein